MKYEIHHIGIIMRDHDEAIDFFVNKLGMELLKESISDKGGYKLEIGVDGKYLLEVFTRPVELQSDVETTGHNHVCFGVDNVEKALNDFSSRGIKVTEPLFDAPTGKFYGFFYGPDDVKFEVYEW